MAQWSRWTRLGLRPPLAQVDIRGTYLETTPRDILNLLPPRYLLCNDIKVSGNNKYVVIEGKGFRVEFPMLGKNIRDVIQAALDGPNDDHTYRISKGVKLVFLFGQVSLETKSANKTTTYTAFPLCFEVIEGLISVEDWEWTA